MIMDKMYAIKIRETKVSRCSYEMWYKRTNSNETNKRTFQQDKKNSKKTKYKPTHHIRIVKAIMKKADGISKVKRFTYIF